MRRLTLYAGFAIVAACASASAPPGGEARHTPPEVIAISVDSGQTNVKVKSVEFKFDEVVSDRPAGAAVGLDQIFLISPRNGAAVVSWHRTRIDVRPKNGFKPNTAYRITMLPGLIDLRNNARKDTRTLVFSTGADFPPYSINGRVFDWSAERPAIGAYIEAISLADTSTVYITATDTAGQFEAGPLPAGKYLVRGLIDANSNRILDRNEKWDSTTVQIFPSSRYVELDAIERDSLPAFFEAVTVVDSLTIRATFDKALDPSLPLQPALIRVQRADSSQLQVATVQWAAAYDKAKAAAAAAAAADSARRADTTKARAAPAPPAPTLPPPGSPRPPPPPPKPKAPAPERAIIITLPATNPLIIGQAYRITAMGMRNLVGHSRDASRSFTVPKPVPKIAPKTPADSAKKPPAKPPG